jgi:DNA primase catalytic subunit
MVSYIRGEGVDVKGGLARYHDLTSDGWTRRIRDGMGDMIDKLRMIARKDQGFSGELESLHQGLLSQSQREGRTSTKGKGSIQSLAQVVNHDARAERLRNGSFGVLEKYEGLFLDLLKTDSSVVLGSAGETDEVVTIDVRRQIRWPTSLHGKSGMRVSEFPLERLDPDGSNRYSALHEALALSTQDMLEVEMVVDDSICQFGDQVFDKQTGERFEIHEAGATFLILKGWAKIVS